MTTSFKILLMCLMSVALFFGFLNLFISETISYNLDRLHIFLFNLCSGATIVLYFTEAKPIISKKVIVFLVMSISYALFAFFEIYIPVLLISVALFMIIESIRINRFSFFPYDFFKSDIPVSEKFHHASLLCLSSGLVISSLVLLNNEYFKFVSMPKLQLDTFFLGFSFPLSLITMSLLFSIMSDNGKAILWLKNIGFWFVNLGVIVFFILIIFEKLLPQVFVTLILFATVIMILCLLIILGKNLQQKAFLVSGMGFLLFTAITGIVYIVFEMTPGYTSENYKWLLRIHSFAALYGWNLCGLTIILRYKDFPLKLHSYTLIIFHWITVLVLAPLGCYFPFFAYNATICFIVILCAIMFTKGKSDSVISVSTR